MDAGEKIRTSYSSAIFFPSSLVFLIVVEWFFNCDCMFFKSKNKQTFTKSKTLPCSKKAVFFIKILLNNCKKQVHKGYPLAGPCICN